jgi:TctA family transporter
MDSLANLVAAFGAVTTLQNLGFALIGCLVGTLVGILPGIGPVATIAMLLPITYSLDPLSSLIMLAGIYYGAQYGGSTTAILINLPGESSSVVTCIEGYQMAQRGRAGSALAIAALSSLFAGCVGTLVIVLLGVPLTRVAQQFSSPDYFSLMLFGLLLAVLLASGSVIKAIAMVVIGLLLGLVGMDINSGQTRLAFGIDALWDGIDFLPLVVGMFGLVEVIRSLEIEHPDRVAIKTRFRELWPSRSEFARARLPAVRGTLVGSILGILPGGGAILSSFASYALEKRLSKGGDFGSGAVEGVAGPEAANNAGAQTSFIPLLTLGLPSNPVMALMMGALMIQGIQPGSAAMSSRPDLFWGLIASMLIGNLMLVIINLPLIGVWVKLLSIPYRYMAPAIVMFCAIGVYCVEPGMHTMVLTAGFAVFGYILLRLGCEPAPLVLGFLLGPLMEENLRRSLVLSRGDFQIFLDRPISLCLLLGCVAVLGLIVSPAIRRSRNEAFQQAD